MKNVALVVILLFLVYEIASFLQKSTKSRLDAAVFMTTVPYRSDEHVNNAQQPEDRLLPQYLRVTSSSRSEMGRKLTEINKKNMLEGIEFRTEYSQLRLLSTEEEQAAGRIAHREWQLQQLKYTIEATTNSSLNFTSWARACRLSERELHTILYMSSVARQLLVQHNIRLVDYWTRRLLEHSAGGKQVSYYELVVQGVLGLSKAAERFDGRPSCRFATFAQPYVMNEIFKGITTLRPGCFLTPQTMMLSYRAYMTQRRLSRALRRQPSDQEVAHALGFTVKRLKGILMDAKTKSTVTSAFTMLAKGFRGDGKGDGNTLTYMDLALNTAQYSAVGDNGQLRDLLWQVGLHRAMSACLTATERRTLILRFGLDKYQQRKSLTVPRVAQLMCATPEGVRKILDRALHKLRNSPDTKAVLQDSLSLPDDATYQTSRAYVTTF